MTHLVFWYVDSDPKQWDYERLAEWKDGHWVEGDEAVTDWLQDAIGDIFGWSLEADAHEIACHFTPPGLHVRMEDDVPFPEVTIDPLPGLERWEDFPREEEAYGAAHAARKRIWINPSLPPDEMCETFLHELGHIVHAEAGNPELDETDAEVLRERLDIDATSGREALAECYALEQLGIDFPPEAKAIYEGLQAQG